MPVAIVTGAGSGIGRAVALRLARMGYALALAGRTQATLDETAALLAARGQDNAGGSGATLVVAADVSRSSDADRLVEETLNEYGRVDVVFNGAGYAPMIPTTAVTPDQWRQILDTNLSSVFYVTRAVWPAMERQHFEHVADHRADPPASPGDRNVITGGVIVNVSSAAVRDPFPGLGAYAVAKAGLNMLTQVTAREGEPLGIRVCAVAPSGVETAMFRSLVSREQVPTDDVLFPEDVADVVANVVDGPLRWTSGEVIYMHRRL